MSKLLERFQICLPLLLKCEMQCWIIFFNHYAEDFCKLVLLSLSGIFINLINIDKIKEFITILNICFSLFVFVLIFSF